MNKKNVGHGIIKFEIKDKMFSAGFRDPSQGKLESLTVDELASYF